MFGRRSAHHLARFSLDSLAAWAVAAAIVFIALIVAGVFKTANPANQILQRITKTGNVRR